MNGLGARAECGKWSRLLRKRELLGYYLLCRDSGLEWNVGDAIDRLTRSLLVSRKVAFSIARRLIKMELLQRVDAYKYRCVGFEKYFEELYRNYVCKKGRSAERAPLEK